MPCLLIASAISLALWPLIRAWQWWTDAPWWACVVAPLAGCFALAAILYGILWLMRTYLDPQCNALQQLTRIEALLDGRSYGWLVLPGTVIAGGTLAMGLWQGGISSVPNLVPPLIFGWLALTDFTHPSPLPPEPLPVPLDDTSLPPADSGKEVVVTYAASLSENATTHSASITIPHAEYHEHRSRERLPGSPISNYGLYVSGGISPSIRRLAGVIRDFSDNHSLESLGEATAVVRLVRDIEYLRDEKTRNVSEWADYPVELLYDQGGDCEDHAILAAAVLHQLGHRVALFWITLKDSAHLALGYSAASLDGATRLTGDHGHEFFYVETIPTSSKHGFGDMPSSFFADLKDSKLISIPKPAAETTSPIA